MISANAWRVMVTCLRMGGPVVLAAARALAARPGRRHALRVALVGGDAAGNLADNDDRAARARRAEAAGVTRDQHRDVVGHGDAIVPRGAAVRREHRLADDGADDAAAALAPLAASDEVATSDPGVAEAP